MTSNLMEAFVFNELSGNVVKGVNGYFGKMVGSVFSQEGIRFQGSDNRVQILPGGSLIASTITIYIDFLVSAAGIQALVAKGAATSASDYAVTVEDAGIFFYATDSIGFNGSSLGNRPANDIRTRICCVLDGTRKLLYVNGVLKSSAARAATIVSSTSKMLFFGVDSNLLRDFTGTIFAVYLFNIALSANQISILHSNPYDFFNRPALARPYLNFGTSGAPPAAEPPKRRPSVQIIMGHDKLGNPIIAYEPQAWAGRRD